MIWFVPSLVGNAITVSIIGVLLGPMYPIAMNRASRILPPWILTGAVGWIGGFGQAGSALIPFMTGAIAEKHGIKSLHPLCVPFNLTRILRILTAPLSFLVFYRLIGMMALMIFLFALTPNKPLVDVAKPKEVLDEKNDEKTSA